MPIKSFAGMLQEDDIQKINLSTNDGSIGYKIHKFQGMPFDTGGAVNTANEAVLKIFSIPQTAASQDVDFSDQTLLGVVYFLRDQGVVAVTSDTIIFDNKIFNQDIFVTYADAQTNTKGFNYYIELEQVRLDLNEATVATLQDIRNITSG